MKLSVMFIYKGIYIYITCIHFSSRPDWPRPEVTNRNKKNYENRTGSASRIGKKDNFASLARTFSLKGMKKVAKAMQGAPRILKFGLSMPWFTVCLISFFRTQSAFQILTRYIWFSQQRMHCSRTHHKTPRYWLVFKPSSGKKNHQPKYKAL